MDHGTMPGSVLAVACTLSLKQLQESRQQLLPGLIERADEVANLEKGVRLHFIQQPGLLVEVARIIEREQSCCAFLSFQIKLPDSASIILEVNGPEGRVNCFPGFVGATLNCVANAPRRLSYHSPFNRTFSLTPFRKGDSCAIQNRMAFYEANDFRSR